MSFRTPRTISRAPTAVDQQIMSIQANLADLQVRYTNRHPEVRQLQSLLADLQAEKAAEERAAMERLRQINEKRRKGEPVDQFGDLSGMANSPVYLNLKKMLAETKSKVAALKVRVKEYREQVAELEEKVNTIPEVEGQLKQLDRDYGVIRSQHAALLKRRETARMGQDMEQKATDVTFRVIDPPYVPLKPSEPNKIMLNAIVPSVGLSSSPSTCSMSPLWRFWRWRP